MVMQLQVKGGISCLTKVIESPVPYLDLFELPAFVYLLDMIWRGIYIALEKVFGTHLNERLDTAHPPPPKDITELEAYLLQWLAMLTAVPLGLGSNPGEDMDICKCIVPSRHGSTLNSHRAASSLVTLMEGEEKWEAPDHPQGVHPELNRCHLFGAQSYG
ncbi:uncharacterized protein TNCV_326381 [Trichonephila clavipes]|nr:uncharacterized protein TNCV_326381 [Trichonephila clavipes]